MNKEIENNYFRWLKEKALTDAEKEELKAIAANEEEIIDRFGSVLEFGTGGLRGVMGLGTNRMNRFVVRRATQGLANYLNKRKKGNSVAIGYDSRNHSHEFAFEAANVLASNGIKVHLYNELMPTPAISYAVRYFKCDAGIVVTASHNPAKYNGYKVYGPDGAQLNLEASELVIEEVLKVDIFKDVKSGNFDKHVWNGSIEFIPEDVIQTYFASTKKTALRDEEKIIDIAYTPLHGAGLRSVTTVLREMKYNLDIVKEQAMPNGDFPTCPYPNPEMEPALKMGIERMVNNRDDILLATDPDSDRVGVVVNLDNGKYRILTGNEVGILLIDYIYNTKKELGTLPDEPVIVKTIVSSDMIDLMAKKWGVKVISVLTGFKFIGEQIHLLEEINHAERYLLGFEESCGYLTNIDIRDKDAVNACLLVSEMANHYKRLGRNLVDQLNGLYKEYGDFKTVTLSFEISGLDGKEKIAAIMEEWRSAKVNMMFDNIDHIGDYQKGIIMCKGHDEPTNLPKSNVIKLFLSTDETITARPSGTEPKIKFYIFALGQKNVEKYSNIINEYMGKK